MVFLGLSKDLSREESLELGYMLLYTALHYATLHYTPLCCTTSSWGALCGWWDVEIRELMVHCTTPQRNVDAPLTVCFSVPQWQHQNPLPLRPPNLPLWQPPNLRPRGWGCESSPSLSLRCPLFSNKPLRLGGLSRSMSPRLWTSWSGGLFRRMHALHRCSHGYVLPDSSSDQPMHFGCFALSDAWVIAVFSEKSSVLGAGFAGRTEWTVLCLWSPIIVVMISSYAISLEMSELVIIMHLSSKVWCAFL